MMTAKKKAPERKTCNRFFKIGCQACGAPLNAWLALPDGSEPRKDRTGQLCEPCGSKKGPRKPPSMLANVGSLEDIEAAAVLIRGQVEDLMAGLADLRAKKAEFQLADKVRLQALEKAQEGGGS